MKPRFAMLLIVFSVLLLSSCGKGHPVLDVNNAIIPAGLSEAKIKNSIILAGTDLGWKFRELKEGALEGQLNVRKHEAVILVEYDISKYSIQYISSQNLNFKEGRIHRNYNNWIKRLQTKIDRELIRASL